MFAIKGLKAFSYGFSKVFRQINTGDPLLASNEFIFFGRTNGLANIFGIDPNPLFLVSYRFRIFAQSQLARH